MTSLPVTAKPKRSLRPWAQRLRARCDAFLTLGTLSADLRPTAEVGALMLADVERALNESTFAGSFSTLIEEQFVRASAEARNRLFARVLLMGIVVYDMFLPVDALIIPDVLWFAVLLQVGVATPVGLIALIFIKRKTGDSVVPVLGALYTTMATTIVIFLSSRSAHIDLIGCAFALIIMACNTGLALSFDRAAVTTGVNGLAAAAAIAMHPSIEGVAKVCIILIMTAASAYSLLGVYRIEASVRRAYLFSLRESLRANILTSANLQLRTLVEIDGLTGIANRRHFDATLDRLWHQAERMSIALVMIDIDAFKALNDRFGHQAGDECLRRVAAALDRETRTGRAALARYGGEEFGLLMDGLDIHQAAEIAERIRSAIAELDMPIGPDGMSVRVTISLGCASLVPTPSAVPFDLVAAADAALYSAKRKGRNRTELAMPSDPPRNIADHGRQAFAPAQAVPDREGWARVDAVGCETRTT